VTLTRCEPAPGRTQSPQRPAVAPSQREPFGPRSGPNGNPLHTLLRTRTAFDDEFVEVRGLGGGHGLQGEVVEDEQVDAGELAHLGLYAVVQPGGLEPPEQLVSAAEQHAVPTADRDVSEGAREVRLADPDWSQDQGTTGVGEDRSEHSSRS